MEKYVILDEEGSHEYDLIVEETDNSTIYSLYASNNGEWSDNFKGTKVLTLTDNGNNVKFNKISIKLDYSDIAEMKLLLDCYSKIDTKLMLDYKIFKEL